MHALLGTSSVVCATPALRRRDAVARRGAVVRVSAESRDSEASTPEPPATMPRRRLLNHAAAATALVVSSKTSPALAGEFTNDAAMAMLNRQGKVKLTDSEWKEKLKDQPFAYEVLRHEATERPFSSPQLREALRRLQVRRVRHPALLLRRQVRQRDRVALLLPTHRTQGGDRGARLLHRVPPAHRGALRRVPGTPRTRLRGWAEG